MKAKMGANALALPRPRLGKEGNRPTFLLSIPLSGFVTRNRGRRRITTLVKPLLIALLAGIVSTLMPVISVSHSRRKL